MKFLKIAALSALIMTAACTRIETGEVGVRIDTTRQVQTKELQAGTLNQVMFGDVLTFPVKDVQVDITDLTPLASDNSTIKDFDMSIVYSVDPKSVAETYINKNRAFHALDEESGDTYLMYNYVHQLGRNAAYKIARKYESLKMADNRALIEQEIKAELEAAVKREKLKLTVSQVLVKQILPADNIVNSANLLVQAQNEQKRKQVEVATAKLEAERIAALNANAGAVEYMGAMALMNISEGIKQGKVNTIVVPTDFKGMISVPSK